MTTYSFRAKKAAAAVAPRSAGPSSSKMVQSSKRLATLFARAEKELSQLKGISNKAAVLNRDMSGSQKAAVISPKVVKAAQKRVRALFRSANQELQRMQKVAGRSASYWSSDNNYTD